MCIQKLKYFLCTQNTIMCNSIAPNIQADISQTVQRSFELVAKFGDTAPFGVGTACASIAIFLKLAKDSQNNLADIANLTSDIEAILCAIENTPKDVRFENAMCALKSTVDSAINFVKKMDTASSVKRFFFATHYKDEIKGINERLIQVKLTLNLGATMFLATTGRHQIPGTENHWSATAAVRSFDNVLNYHCMIEKGTRCSSTLAKYGLTCKTNPHINYIVCGNCAQDRKNAWWKNYYTRTKLV